MKKELGSWLYLDEDNESKGLKSESKKVELWEVCLESKNSPELKFGHQHCKHSQEQEFKALYTCEFIDIH